MRKSDTQPSRRRFMQVAGTGIAALPFAGMLAGRGAIAAELTPLSVDDPTAKALAYVETSTTDGQLCNNCNFWQGGDAETGGCPLFPGKSVTAKGWCKSWVKKS